MATEYLYSAGGCEKACIQYVVFNLQHTFVITMSSQCKIITNKMILQWYMYLNYAYNYA